MSVKKNADGIYYFYIRYKDRNGEIKQKKVQSSCWKTRKEAKVAEAEFIKNSLTNNITRNYGDLYSIYQETRKNIDKLSTITTANYIHKEHILPIFGNLTIQEITPQIIERWQNSLMDKKYSNAYLKQIQSHFKRVLSYCEVYDYIDKNPFYRPFVKRKETRVKAMSFYTQTEFETYVSYITEPLDLAIFETLYWCGLRKGELLALRIIDFDFEKDIIHIHQTYDQRSKLITTPKNKNGFRDVMFQDRVKKSVQTLIELKKQSPCYSEEMFVFGNDVPMTLSTLDRRNRYYSIISGVKRIKIHEFRHSHVSLLISLGYGYFDIAKRMGHTVNEVTETYGHWFVDSQKKMMDQLNKISMKEPKCVTNLN